MAAAKAELTTTTLATTLSSLAQARTLLQARQDWVKTHREETDGVVEAVARLKEDVQRALHRVVPAGARTSGTVHGAVPGRQ